MPARTHKIRVMIADDHAILRAGLKMLVNAQADMEVVSEASDGEKAVQTARETRPEVALLDLTMPRVGGMKALQEMARTAVKPACSFSQCTMTLRTCDRHCAAGASGYLLKRAVDARACLLQYERCIAEGSSWIPVWPTFLSRTYSQRKVQVLVPRDRKHP